MRSFIWVGVLGIGPVQVIELGPSIGLQRGEYRANEPSRRHFALKTGSKGLIAEHKS